MLVLVPLFPLLLLLTLLLPLLLLPLSPLMFPRVGSRGAAAVGACTFLIASLEGMARQQRLLAPLKARSRFALKTAAPPPLQGLSARDGLVERNHEEEEETVSKVA